MNDDKHLIIGNGQIGKSLYNVLIKTTDVEIIDKEWFSTEGLLDFLHITFGYDENFEKEVFKYQETYQPKHTIIHSTVPVGTSKRLKAVHSPVIGIHPYLEESIETFTKFVGGEGVDEVADMFRKCGIKIQKSQKSETTEFAKLQSTLFYGVCIEFVKEMETLCDKHNIPFSEAYTLWTQTYNEGYKKLGHPEYNRPILQPLQKKMGGHCVKPNLKLSESKFAKFIDERN